MCGGRKKSGDPVMNLQDSDLSMFARLCVPYELLVRAGVDRITDQSAREEHGITGSGNMGGLVFPYLSPMDGVRRTCRVRRDRPEMESGKPEEEIR